MAWFSQRRHDGESGPNDLTRALETRRSTGLPILDLTLSNPTQCGLRGPEGWAELLNHPDVVSYDPNSQGSLKAREAIAEYYAGRGISIQPEDLFLTSGTSEGYSHLFKLICDPGDTLLVPHPSYPVLETLADLEGIKRAPYDQISSLQFDDRARGLCVVQPNNPTGKILGGEDSARLRKLAEERGFALIVDEVFSDYTFGSSPPLLLDGPLVFTLNGLSKLLGLPQLKLAWIHVGGSGSSLKAAAKRRLEWICDAYLSVGGPVQAACPELLRRRAEFQKPIQERLHANLASLRTLAETTDRFQPLWPQGGWCVPLRCPGIEDDEAFAVQLLESEGVLVHPGYFFDFEADDIIVVSLLPEPEIFRQGMENLLRYLTP